MWGRNVIMVLASPQSDRGGEGRGLLPWVTTVTLAPVAPRRL
jgi:hypothetical protein